MKFEQELVNTIKEGLGKWEKLHKLHEHNLKIVNQRVTALKEKYPGFEFEFVEDTSLRDLSAKEFFVKATARFNFAGDDNNNNGDDVDPERVWSRTLYINLLESVDSGDIQEKFEDLSKRLYVVNQMPLIRSNLEQLHKLIHDLSVQYPSVRLEVIAEDPAVALASASPLSARVDVYVHGVFFTSYMIDLDAPGLFD